MDYFKPLTPAQLKAAREKILKDSRELKELIDRNRRLTHNLN